MRVPDKILSILVTDYFQPWYPYISNATGEHDWSSNTAGIVGVDHGYESGIGKNNQLTYKISGFKNRKKIPFQIPMGVFITIKFGDYNNKVYPLSGFKFELKVDKDNINKESSFSKSFFMNDDELVPDNSYYFELYQPNKKLITLKDVEKVKRWLNESIPKLTQEIEFCCEQALLNNFEKYYALKPEFVMSFLSEEVKKAFLF